MSILKKLADAQAKIWAVKRDSENPYFKSEYASLEAVLRELHPILSGIGLVITYSVEVTPLEPARIVDKRTGEELTIFSSAVVVHTTVHDPESGEHLKFSFPSVTQRSDPQGIKACITYGRRVGLQCLFNLADVDDDAESSVIHHGEKVATPEALPSFASPAQLKLIAELMDETGLRVREEILQFVEGVVGRPVEKRTDLTKEEAQKLINALYERKRAQKIRVAIPEPDQPPTPAPSQAQQNEQSAPPALTFKAPPQQQNEQPSAPAVPQGEPQIKRGRGRPPKPRPEPAPQTKESIPASPQAINMITFLLDQLEVPESSKDRLLFVTELLGAPAGELLPDGSLKWNLSVDDAQKIINELREVLRQA